MSGAAVALAVAEPAEVLVAEPAGVLAAEPVEALVAEPAEVPVAEPAEALVAELVQAVAADWRVHSEADRIRATRSRRRCNPLPALAVRLQTMRQEVLPGGCSPHINARPPRRFLIPTGRSATCCERIATVGVGIISSGLLTFGCSTGSACCASSSTIFLVLRFSASSKSTCATCTSSRRPIRSLRSMRAS